MKTWMHHGLLASTLLLACSSSDGGMGKVAFSTWGEEFIEEELPAEEFADGWSVRFTKFLIAIDGITVADGDAVGVKHTEQRVFDMTKPGKKAIFEAELAAKEWPNVSFRIGPVGTGAVVDASATDEDLQRMQQGGFSVVIEGVGSKGDVSKSFSWAFASDTTYKNCKGEISGAVRAGAVVTEGGTDSIELTIHGDHFFYDDLASADAKLRFANMAAADANDDGVISQEELGAIELADLTDGTYRTGGFADVVTYAEFIARLSQSLGHYRGEGECEL